MKKKALSFHVKNRSSNPAYFFQARYKKKFLIFVILIESILSFFQLLLLFQLVVSFILREGFIPRRFSALEIDLYDSFFTRQPGLVHTNQI